MNNLEEVLKKQLETKATLLQCAENINMRVQFVKDSSTGLFKEMQIINPIGTIDDITFVISLGLKFYIVTKHEDYMYASCLEMISASSEEVSKMINCVKYTLECIKNK